jgi:CBS-domain-containing membrane protein
MSQPAYRVRITASLEDAACLMSEHDIGAVPVVDDRNRVVGIVTDRDVAMAAYHHVRTLPEIPVRDVMSTSIQAARSEEPIVDASSRMARHQVRRLPVHDATGMLVGVLSLDDLAQASADPESSGISEHDVADTLRAVSASPTTAPRIVTA